MNGIWKVAFSWAIAVGAFGMSSAHAAAAKPAIAAQKPCAPITQGKVASLAQAARNITCSMLDRRVLIVGELHGGDQTPELVMAIARDASAGRPVRVGLEIPVEERAGLTRFLHSSGTPKDQALLLQGRFWDGEDGRSSKAMLRMLDHLRALMASGADVDAFPMEQYGDAADIARLGGILAAKEAGMAKAVEQVVEHATPRTLVIALMGNFHARYGKKFIPIDVPTPSVPERLKRFSPWVVLPMAHRSNTWNCINNSCGMHKGVDPNVPPGALPQFVVDSSLPAAELWLATMTGSPPAKASPEKKTPASPGP